jgi:alpha-mannosidase
VASNDDTKTVGGFDSKGDAIPAEMLPSTIDYDGVQFHLAPAGTGKVDAVVAKGQKIELPAGRYNRVYVLAAADGDQNVEFHAGDKAAKLDVEDWGGFIGQWDTRQWKPKPLEVQGRGGNFNNPNGTPPPPTPLRQDWAISANHATWDNSNRGSADWSPRYPEDYLGLKPGYIKRADLAWYASHHHTSDGLNEPYQYSYLFAYAIDLPANARTLTLPDNAKVRVLAVSVAEENPEMKPAQPLYDVLGSK